MSAQATRVELSPSPKKWVKGKMRPDLPAMVLRITSHALARLRVRAPSGMANDAEGLAKLVRRWWLNRKTVKGPRDEVVDLVPLPHGPEQASASFAVVRPALEADGSLAVVTVLSREQVDHSMATGIFLEATP